MLVPTNVVNAALSVARGLVRLSRRVDNLTAEHAALRADLALHDTALLLPPSAASMLGALLTHLRDTEGVQPDPLGQDRDALEQLVHGANRTEATLLEAMQTFLPDQIVWTISDPEGSFRRQLYERRSTWNLDDEDILRAVYYLEPGSDPRRTSTTWRIALAVVEVTAELAVENADVLLRDATLRPVIEATLVRFADPEQLDGSTGPGKLLRHLLRSTLNGALDHADLIEDQTGGWVPGLLDALLQVRETQGDDFVAGLVQGQGYPQLVAALLDQGVTALDEADASAFERLAAEVLGAAADKARDRATFEGFIAEHWSGLLESALDAVQANGALLLRDARPAARVTLLSTIDVLADLDGRDVLQVSTLTRAVEAAIGAVAADPVLLNDDGKRSAWLNELLRSLATVSADAGLEQILTPGGVQTLLQTTLASVAEHPALVGREGRFVPEALTRILKELAGAPTLGRDLLTRVAVDGVLATVAEQPGLLDTDYPVLVGRIAATLADALEDGQLTRDDGQALLLVAVERAAEGGLTLDGDQADVVSASLQALLTALRLPDARLFSTSTLRQVGASALDSVLRRPDLFAGQPDLLAAAGQAIVEQVLGQDLRNVRLRPLAGAAVRGVLVTFAQRPELAARGRHGQVIAAVAGALGEAMSDLSLSLDEARGILDELFTLALEEPWIFPDDEDRLLAEALTAFLRVWLADHRALVGGPALIEGVRAALAVVIADPRLFRNRPQLLADAARAVVDEVLVPSRQVPAFAELALAGVLAVLETVEEQPQLLDTAHPRIVATLAGALAGRLENGRLSNAQARDLLIALAFALRDDVAVFAERESLASKLLDRVLERLLADTQDQLVVRGDTLVDLVQSLVAVVAAHGVALLANDSIDKLLERLDAALAAVLREARPLVGRGLDLTEAAELVARVVRRWAQGGVSTFENPQFAALVNDIAQELAS